MSEEKIGMYSTEEIYEELANGFLHRSMVDAMYFKIKDLQQKIEQLEKEKDYLDDYNRHLHNENEQLENIRKEAKKKINNMFDNGNETRIIDDLLELDNMLNKGSDKE